LVQQEKYYDAEKLLEPYSEKINPGMSNIWPLQSYLKVCNTDLALNEQLSRDSGLRDKRLAQQQQESEWQQRLASWQRAPGPWYDQVQELHQKYQSLNPGIRRSMEDTKGSAIVYDKIQSTWAKIQDYPSQMAELAGFEFKIAQKGRRLPTEPQEVSQYVRTKTILPKVTEEIRQIKDSLDQIQNQIRSGWVEEETLRNLLRPMESLARQFKQEYEIVSSKLETLTLD